MAWVDVRAQFVPDVLMAEGLDGAPWPDGRYFQVAPGAHQLELRYTYEIRNRGINGLLESNQRTCYLRLDYPAFAAGQRYRVRARELALRARVWLTDGAGRKLAEAGDGFCTP